MLHFSRLEVGVTDANNPDDVIAWTLVQQIPLVQVSDGNLRLNRKKFIIKVFTHYATGYTWLRAQGDFLGKISVATLVRDLW